MRAFVLQFIFCLLGAGGTLVAQTINATQTDEIINDAGVSAKADPGDKIRYTITVSETGNVTNATGVQVTVSPDALTTLVGGSFKTSPVAVNDGTYDCIGNVGITVPAASGVKVNDFDDNLAGATLSCGTCTSANGGTVTIANDGSFTYLPAPGFTGSDNFTYTITDVTQAGPGAPTTNTATVSINVAGMIWFVDENQGSNGNGRLGSPFNTLPNFVASTLDEAGENIFLYSSADNYAGGITLLDNQKLIGQGATASLATITGLTVPTHSNPLPATGGTRPTVVNAGGDGISVVAGNTIRGLNVGACADFAIDDNSGVSTLTISEVDINNTTGGGFSIDNGGTLAVTLGSLSSNGGSRGILLAVASGTMTVNGGTITNPTAEGIAIVSGTVALTASTNVSVNADSPVSVSAHSTGAVTLSGTIASTGEGISLSNNSSGTITFSGSSKSLTTGTNAAVNMTNNSGATINFTNGGLAITTTSGTGFLATSGGSVSVQGSNNTISSTTGTALNVANTTITLQGLTFRSISKNGGTNNGIILNNTGVGGLTISGNGSAGTGGTIENIVGADAISLNTTGGLISLNYLNIEDITHANDASDANHTHSGVDAIHGRVISGGLTLANSTIQRISDNAINGTVDASPVTGNPTNTTWSGLTLTNNTIQNTNRFNVASRGDQTNESAVIIWGVSGTVSMTGNTFQNCSSGIDFVTHTSGTLNMTVQSNTFTTLYKEIGTSSIGRFGISVVQEGTLTSTVLIGDWQNETNASLGNTFTNGGNIAGIRVISNTTAMGNLKASIAKNTFTVTDHSSPGQPPGNTIYNFPQSGVLLRHVGNPAFAGGGNFESIVAANTFNECMHADGGLGNVTVGMEKGNAETIIRNNTFNKPWDLPMELRSDGQSNTQASSLIQVTGNTHIDGIVGDGTTDLGGQSPYGSTYVQVRNNGRMDLTMQTEATPLGLTDPSSATGPYSLFTQTTGGGDIFNLFLQNLQGPRGYRLSHAAGTTFNLFRNGSASGTAQGVLQDNNVLGGGGVDNTSPPSVTATGTITLSAVAPALPSITIP